MSDTEIKRCPHGVILPHECRACFLETPSSLAAEAGSARETFESWMSCRSDLARPLDRFADHTRAGNPGDYKDASVQLAWEAWLSSQNTPLCESAEHPPET